MNPIFDFFLEPYYDRPAHLIILEAIAFFFGIASVVYAKNRNVLVYPTGLVATVITVYLFLQDELMGDMMMNFYYSIMSLYGWWNWSRKKEGVPVVPISRTTKKEKVIGFLLFIITMIVTYAVYRAYGTVLSLLIISIYLLRGFSLLLCGIWQTRKLKIGPFGSLPILLQFHFTHHEGGGCFLYNI